MLNNHKLFFPDWFGLTNGWPGKLLKDERMKALHHDFTSSPSRARLSSERSSSSCSG
jgi:hypothetical protein